MGTLSGDDYYQQRDEDAYYDSWEFARDQDRMQNIYHPDEYYIKRHNTIAVPIATASEKDAMRDRYATNKAAKVGDTISCACCGKSFVKKQYQQAFCAPKGKGKGRRYKCKDKYHNLTDAKRAARANLYS